MFLKYNGVEMSRVQITRFHAENEYGGDSFNATGRRYELDGVGVVATGETPAGGTASLTTIDQLRTLLSQPRKLLQYRFQDTVAYVNLATSSDGWNGSSAYDSSLASISDSRNGPIPTITIQKIVGTTSKAVFFVAFSFRWFGCSSDRVQRFEFVLTHNIDTSGFTTLNYGGTLEMSNRWSAQTGTNTPVSGTGSWGPQALENADIGPFPDLYRRLVAPPPPNQFFRRTKQNYVAHPNLRTLTWDIEDKELFRAMPGGTGTQRSGTVDLPDGDASFTFSRGLDPNAGGPQGRKTFEMTLRANRETDPAAMIEYIFRASMARIAWVPTPGVANSYPDIIESVVIEEPNIYTDNKLRVTISAMGSDASTTQVPFNVITRMFTSLAAQTGGNPQYADAYQTGAYINGQSVVDPLKFEICTSLYETLNEVLTPSESEEEEPAGDDKPFGSQPAELPDDLVKPELDRDLAFTGDSDGKIRNYASKQKIETYDTGMFYLEATGSSLQWPVQLRLPVVFVTQTVEMTTVDTSVPIPWPELPGEAVLVKRTEVSVDDAPPDASGKSVFSVVATRTVQVSIASSPNRLLSEDGIPRVQWSPETVPQARSPYTQNQQFDFRVADKSGNANRQGYVA